MEQSNKFFQEFNRIQNSFYTSKEDFENYTQYELKKHGYVLISNLAKGFPHLAEMRIYLFCVYQIRLFCNFN